MNIINKIRSWNYRRLARRSFKKAVAAWDKASDYGFADPSRFPYEEEFSLFMTRFRKRERKAKELSLSKP